MRNWHNDKDGNDFDVYEYRQIDVPILAPLSTYKGSKKYNWVTAN